MFDLSLTGVARNGIRLANALASRGHDVHLVVCRTDGRTSHPLDERVTVTAVGGAGRSRGAALVAALPALRRTFTGLAPDALVSLGNHGHLIAMAASLGLRQVNRVYRISNDLDHPGDGAILRGLRRLSMAALVRSARRLMLVSPHLADHPAFADIDERRLAVVANGVETAEIRRLAQGQGGHPWLDDSAMPCIVSVGRIAPQKNYPTLLRALALANREKPVRLIVLGQGKDKARRELMALAEELDLADRVALLGLVDNPFPYVSRAAAFVLPSLWEGASNALLEAVALDVPVIASRTAGNAQDVLAYGRFGLIVDPLDARALARAILWQTGPEACRPGTRHAEFDAALTTERACRLILDAAGEGRPFPAARPESMPGRQELQT